MEKSNFLLELIKSFIISIVIVFIIINFIALPVRVSGDSMYPTLHNGDFGFSGIFTKLFDYKRYDVVVIENENTQQKIVKRIIGLPNELITYKDSQLYVNELPVEEPFLDESVYTDDFSIQLGDNEYFCLGDNREVSRDSRYYGAFRKDDIVSRKILVLFPFSDLGIY